MDICNDNRDATPAKIIVNIMDGQIALSVSYGSVEGSAICNPLTTSK